MSQDFLERIGLKAPAQKPATPPPVALTIAGSDSGGGAGIQADLKSFAACRVHGTTVLTLVTAQNTRGVDALHLVPEEVIRAQFLSVTSDLPPAAAKTGAMGSQRIISLVAELLEERPIDRLVVDPVMVSKHGDPLLPSAAQHTLRDRLLPRALLVTPNRFEAEVLSGRTVEGISSMKDAAKALFDRGARGVLLKGSHLDDKIVRDLYFDGTGFIEYGADRIDSDRVHGSGCVFAAVCCARLAHGDAVEDALGYAREFISGAIEHAPKLGGGISPVDPMHRAREEPRS